MKTQCFAICFLFLLPGFVTEVQAQQTEFGIKGGISPYTLSFSSDAEKTGRSRTHLGFFSNIDLGRTKWGDFSIQPEIIYSLQGAELTEDDRLITLDYLNIPVLVQYRPVLIEGLSFQAGPQVGLLINARSDQDGAAVDLKRRMRTLDFGVSTGMNYLHRPTRLGVDIRYNIGLRTISDNGSLQSRNRGFQIGVFYLFDFTDQL